MTNKYPGQCTCCGYTVRAGSGKVIKVNGKWTVKHENCETEEKPTFKQRFGRCEDAPCCGCC